MRNIQRERVQAFSTVTLLGNGRDSTCKVSDLDTGRVGPGACIWF